MLYQKITKNEKFEKKIEKTKVYQNKGTVKNLILKKSNFDNIVK